MDLCSQYVVLVRNKQVEHPGKLHITAHNQILVLKSGPPSTVFL